jgi:predicted phage tail protein
MREVRLYGRLRKTCGGGEFNWHVSSVAEVIRLLVANFQGAEQELAKGSYRVFVGERKAPLLHVDEQTIPLHLPPTETIHIQPWPQGAKNAAAGKIILGVALIVVSYGIGAAAAGAYGAGAAFGSSILGSGITWGNIALFGAALAVSGVAMMLTPTPPAPTATSQEPPDQRSSFLISGQVNAATQGQPIPLVYGHMRVGSLVISAGMSAESI